MPPDEPTIDPAVEPAVEPLAVVELAPEPVVEPTPVPEPEPATPAPRSDSAPKWALERIGEETNKRQSAEERASAAEARSREYEQIVRRMQADPKATPTDPPPAPTERRTPATPQTDVEREAQRIVLNRDLENVSHAGVTSYGAKWGDAVNRLNAYGANSAEFVASVLEIDPAKAHEIMFQISQDGEKAVSLARMSPVRRAAEITRMIDMAAAPKVDPAAKVEPKPDAPAISRAPSPKPALAPRAPAPEVDPTTPEGNEKLSDAEFEAYYKNKYYRKTA